MRWRRGRIKREFTIRMEKTGGPMVWAARLLLPATVWPLKCCILAMMVTRETQAVLFPFDIKPEVSLSASSTFVPNMGLPVHRWFRYSAGFSAEWAESVIKSMRGPVRVFDPFAGSATTLLAAEACGVESCGGIEAHPFVSNRVARAKLSWRNDVRPHYLRKIDELRRVARDAVQK